MTGEHAHQCVDSGPSGPSGMLRGSVRRVRARRGKRVRCRGVMAMRTVMVGFAVVTVLAAAVSVLLS
jgi:hypothetical protein